MKNTCSTELSLERGGPVGYISQQHPVGIQVWLFQANGIASFSQWDMISNTSVQEDLHQQFTEKEMQMALKVETMLNLAMR